MPPRGDQNDRACRACTVRFLDSSGTFTAAANTITVRIDRRAYSPVLRQASLPADTTIPWWQGRRLHFEFS